MVTQKSFVCNVITLSVFMRAEYFASISPVKYLTEKRQGLSELYYAFPPDKAIVIYF